jgi:hypothetical protein
MTPKSESLLILTAVTCGLLAAVIGAIQHFSSSTTETARVEEEEPQRIPLPAGPRKFQ